MRRGIFRIQNPEAVAKVRPHEYMEYPAQKPVNQERSALLFAWAFSRACGVRR